MTTILYYSSHCLWSGVQVGHRRDGFALPVILEPQMKDSKAEILNHLKANHFPTELLAGGLTRALGSVIHS